ncbi:MAG: nucleotide exchange factor GrpE [Candidatus Levyibacteriota bacterium]
MSDKNKKQLNDEEEILEDQLLEDQEEEVSSEDGKVELLEARITELEDQLKRAVADYRNLEVRQREEKIEFVKYANKNLIESLLPAFDTLLLAEKYTQDENFKVTVKHVLDVLKNAGIERIGTNGKQFDPATMEAVEVVEGKENEVVEETQPGFSLEGKVIRPARVKVGGKK